MSDVASLAFVVHCDSAAIGMSGIIGESEASEMSTPLLTRDDITMSSPESGDLMTTAEVMAFTGWSRNTLERRMKAGRLLPVNRSPAFDRVKTLKFRRADVERALRGEPPAPAEG